MAVLFSLIGLFLLLSLKRFCLLAEAVSVLVPVPHTVFDYQMITI